MKYYYLVVLFLVFLFIITDLMYFLILKKIDILRVVEMSSLTDTPTKRRGGGIHIVSKK